MFGGAPMIPLRSFVRVFALFACSAASAQVEVGGAGPEFPPGKFTDGKQYQVSDYRGKVVVIFLYEQNCPRCRGTVPERNAVVKKFKDKPVKFFAVGAGDSLNEVESYGKATGLAMPILADPLGLMEARCGTNISLNNIWQFRVIGADGKLVGYSMDVDFLERVVSKVGWKYKDKGYDPKLAAAVEALEWNQWAEGVRLLGAYRRGTNKAAKESAEKLFAEVKTEGEAWKTEADGAVESDPVKAFDLYTKIQSVFVTDELGKSVAEPLRKLRTNKAVIAELGARRVWAQMAAQLPMLTPERKPMFAAAVADIAKKFPGTPTAEKATALAAELMMN